MTSGIDSTLATVAPSEKVRRHNARGDLAAKCAETSFGVVIASYGRKAVLHETVRSLLRQRLLPAEIIISVPSLEHVEERTISLPRVKVVLSERGSCHQRNTGVRALSDSSRYVAFFDDDIELDVDYLANMYEMLERHGEVVIATGHVLADGARIGGIDRESARRVVAQAAVSADQSQFSMTDVNGAYGCNMVVCRWLADELEFDERLPLYGWLEDFDYSMQALRFGRIVKFTGCRSVHLAQQSGRVSGYRFGYSQMVNPCYIMGKGNGIRPWSLVRVYWLPVLLRNGISIWDRVRRERFVGNLRGLAMIFRGRVEPGLVQTMA